MTGRIGSILCAAIGLAIFVLSPSTASGQTANTSVTYDGGHCTVCGGSYACSNGHGNWSNGQRSFNDPVPNGNVVTRATYRVEGLWGCGGNSSSLTGTLNGQSVGGTSGSGQCSCGTCDSQLSMASNTFINGFPGYRYGQSNTVQIAVGSGVSCIRRVNVTLNYGSSGPTVDARGPYTVNEGATTTLTATGSGNGLRYDWDFDNDGQYDDATGPSVAYTGLDGTRSLTIRVRATDNQNQQATDTATLTERNVNPSIANLTVNPPSPSESSPAVLTASASDPAGGRDPLTYAWDFGDGQTNNNGGPTPSHTWRDAGSYTVRVTVTDGDGGSATRTLNVSVGGVAPSAGNISGPTVIDEGTQGTWSDVFTKARFDDVTWTFGWGDNTASATGNLNTDVTSGTATANHTYADDGTFTITFSLRDDDNQTHSRTLSVTVRNVAPTITNAAVNPDRGNEGGTFVFTVSATDPGDDTITYSWDFGDGTPAVQAQNPSHVYTESGTYTAVVTARDEDGGSSQRTVIVVVEDSAPEILSLTGDTTGDEGDRFDYTGVARDPGGDELTYTWSFGDGTPNQSGVDLTSVSHTYASDGTYTLTLSVTDGAETVTRTLEITVGNVAPTIGDVTVPDEGNEGAALNLSATASDPGGDTLTYTWDFGDGETDTGREVTHTWADDGVYFVELTVSDDDGASASEVRTLIINNVSPAIVTLDGDFSGDQGDTLSYTASATDPGDDTLTFTWDFGDGSQDRSGVDLTDVDHVYTQSGTYTLTLTVSDEDGGSSSTTRTVNIGGQAPTIVSLTGDTEGGEGSIFSYNAVVTEPGNDPVTYTWDFGDGSDPVSAVNLTDVNHTYGEDGQYTLELTATDRDGSATATLTINVANLPPRLGDISVPETGIEGQLLAVAATATDPAGFANDPLTYRWDFGDGSDPETGQTRTHTYTDDGEYTVTLTVSDDDGGSISVERTVTITNVAPNIVQLLGPNSVDEAATANFVALASDPGSDDLTYTWNFGDGSNPESGIDLTEVSHRYADNGTYQITVRVSDGDADTTRSLSINVRNLPPTINQLDGDTTGPENGTFSFEAAATDPAGAEDPLTYSWDFGDGSPVQTGANLTDVSHVYEDAGAFTLTLTVDDGDGGTDRRLLTVNVGNEAPIISALTGDETGNEGDNLSFQAVASDPGGDALTYTWNFGDGALPESGQDLTEVAHIFRDNGTYTVTLTVTDGADAVTETLEVNVVNVAPTVVEMLVPETSDEGRFIDVAARATDPAGDFDPLTYTWDFGDGTDEVEGRVVQHRFADDGTFTVSVTVTDGDGGSATREAEITVGNLDPLLLLFDGPERIGEGSPFRFLTIASDVPNDTLTYRWELEDGPTREGIAETQVAHTYPDNGTFTVSLVIRDEDGGSVSETRELEVFNVAPTVTEIIGDFSGEEGQTLSWSGRATDPGDDELTYIWAFGDSDDPGDVEFGQDVSHVYTDAGIYTLTLTVQDDDGGSVTVTRTINIGTAGPSITLLDGPTDGIEGQELSFSTTATDPTDQPLTVSWDFGDGTDPVVGIDLFAVSHTYADDDNYFVSVTVTDPDDNAALATQTVRVANVPPTIVAFDVGEFTENEPGTANAAATDPAGEADPLTYTWNWGDGSEPDTGIDLTTVTHTYEQNGVYTVVLTVSDGDGGTATRTTQVVVGDRPPAVEDVLGDRTGNEGDTITYDVRASDPAGDDLSYVWRVNNEAPISTGTNTIFSYTFPDNGTYTIAVTATDGEGQSASDAFEVSILNVAPSIGPIEGRTEGNEGERLGYFARATDPAGVNDELTYTWDFGDDTPTSEGVDLTDVEHTWAQDGTYTLTLTVADDDGGVTSQTLEITIGNVAPQIASSPSQFIVPCRTYEYTIEVNDPGADEHTFELVEGPEGMTLEDQTLTWTPTLEQLQDESFHVTIRVCDDDECVDQEWDIVSALIDGDGDQVPDDCEEDCGLDPTDPDDAFLDPDMDNLTNGEECLRGSDPNVFSGPTAPEIVSPEIGGRADTLTPDLVVTNATDPDTDTLTYEFELFADADLTEPITAESGIAEGTDTTSWTVPVELTENSHYWWRARAADPFVSGPWTETGDFVVDVENEPPTVPVLVRPMGSADTLTPTLEIEASTDPEGDDITYHYEVYSDAELTDIVVAGDSAEITLAIERELTEDTWYWWRASAEDELGLSSAWAEPLRFLINTENQLPPAPVIIRPTEGELVEEVPVEIEWQHPADPDGDAVTYSLQVVVEGSNVEVALFEDIPMGDLETVTQAVEGLQEDQRYTARVTAFDPFGMGGSAEVTFTVNAENTPPKGLTIISPRDGVSVGPGIVDLVFNPGFDPDDHVFHATVRVYADEGRQQLLWETTIEDITPAEDFTSQWDAGNEGRTLWWTVSTIDEFDLPGPTAGPEEFVIESSAPTAPVPISPIGGVAVDNTFDMSWTNATDPDADALTYTVEIYTDEELTDMVWSRSGIEEKENESNVFVDDFEPPNAPTFYWIVYATDANGLDGERSVTANFNLVATIDGSVAGSECACETPARPVGSAVWVLLLAMGFGLATLGRLRG